MKYLKLFENFWDKKAQEYQKYTGKYVVLEQEPKDLYLAQFVRIIPNAIVSGNFAEIKYYKWEEEYKKYINHFANVYHVSSFDVLKSFDTLEEAIEEYEIMKNMKKYNL